MVVGFAASSGVASSVASVLPWACSKSKKREILVKDFGSRGKRQADDK